MGGLFLGWFAIDKDGRVACDPNPTGFQKPDGWPAVLLQARLKGLKVFSMYFADQSTSNISELLEDPVARDSLAQEDVYKRQPQTYEYLEKMQDRVIRFVVDNSKTVSYTHLDVYKRQPQNSSFQRSRIGLGSRQDN